MQSSTKLRVNGRHLMWLAGVLGNPGRKPALSAAGDAIEFVTIDQVPHTITFAAFSKWVDRGPTAVARASPSGGGGLYQWINGEGSIQVGSLAQVPAKYRSKATLVEADVAIVTNENRAKPVDLPQADEPSESEQREARRHTEFLMTGKGGPAAKTPSKPTHDAEGRPITRNELGEDHLEYTKRITEENFNRVRTEQALDPRFRPR